MSLHESADTEGHGIGEESQDVAAVVQQEPDEPLPHVPASASSVSGHSGADASRPVPCSRADLMSETQSEQCAESGVTSFDAAIHCSSVKCADGGGVTPLRIAHVSR